VNGVFTTWQARIGHESAQRQHLPIRKTVMGLLGTDTYRSFVIGFGAGAIALFAVLAAQGQAPFSARLVPSAQAAPALPDNTLAAPDEAPR
jgi:hypothetical protein